MSNYCQKKGKGQVMTHLREIRLRKGDAKFKEGLRQSTRPDTRLPQSRGGGKGPYLRSVEHLGRSNEAKNPINAEKVKCD